MESNSSTNSAIEVYGNLGLTYEICIYELSEDEYNEFLEQGEVDEDLIDEKDDLGEYRLPIWPPELTSNGRSIEISDLPRTARDVILPDKGSHFAIQVIEWKGLWGCLDLSSNFNPSQLDIETIQIRIGAGEKSITLPDLVSLSYADASISDESLAGKGEEWYLVDKDGNVTEL